MVNPMKSPFFHRRKSHHFPSRQVESGPKGHRLRAARGDPGLGVAKQVEARGEAVNEPLDETMQNGGKAYIYSWDFGNLGNFHGI